MGAYKRKLSRGIRFFYSGQHLNVKYHSRAIYHTKGECLKAERAELNKIDEQERNPSFDFDIKDIVNLRLDEIQARHSKKYYEENKRFLKMLVEYVGNVKVSSIRKHQINSMLIDFSRKLKSEGKDNWKVNACMRCLKSFFNFCINVYDVDMANPLIGFKFYPVKINVKHIPTQAEIDKVLSLCTPPQKFLINFLDETGCRIMEAVRLKYSDIDSETVTLYTRKSKNSNFTPRTIPLPECLKGKTGKGKVFKDWNESPRFLENKTRKLKMHWSYHNLRHRRASIWANSGMNLIEIQYRLGHSNLQTTQGYLQLLKRNFL